jgi:hypothetical protein
MLRFGDAILSNKFLSPAKTRQWLSPASNTSVWGYAMGYPWEIIRTDQLTSDRRIIDIYTKGGDWQFYHCAFALIPDYDLSITMHASGMESPAPHAKWMFTELYNIILPKLMPALEKAGKDEAAERYAGTYSDEESNSTLTLAIDDGPGLSIVEWKIRGIDALFAVGNIGESGKPVEGRLFPTNLTTESQEAWRAVLDTRTDEEREKADADIFFQGSWGRTFLALDRLVYNFKCMDEFIFGIGEDGKASSVGCPAFEITMKRAASS